MGKGTISQRNVLKWSSGILKWFRRWTIGAAQMQLNFGSQNGNHLRNKEESLDGTLTHLVRFYKSGLNKFQKILAFAQKGFDVVGIDFADSPVSIMRSRSKELGVEENFQAVQADVFALDEKFNEQFDYVVEYTCFCAIDPQRREEYI